jgi:hypothetical protein
MGQNGKITRLPHGVREELNRRLRDGEKGRRLVDWLNSLPEVKAVLRAEFGGGSIREQNLSEYRKRGYREWLERLEAMAEARRVTGEGGEFERLGPCGLTDRFSVWAAARYMQAAAKLKPLHANDDPDWRLLRRMCRDVVELRRADHLARHAGVEERRLKIEEERLAMEQGQTAAEILKLLEEMAGGRAAGGNARAKGAERDR